MSCSGTPRHAARRSRGLNYQPSGYKSTRSSSWATANALQILLLCQRTACRWVPTPTLACIVEWGEHQGGEAVDGVRTSEPLELAFREWTGTRCEKDETGPLDALIRFSNQRRPPVAVLWHKSHGPPAVGFSLIQPITGKHPFILVGLIT